MVDSDFHRFEEDRNSLGNPLQRKSQNSEMVQFSLSSVVNEKTEIEHSIKYFIAARLRDSGKSLRDISFGEYYKVEKVFAIVWILIVCVTVLLVLGYKYGGVTVEEDRLNVAVLSLTLVEFCVQIFINNWQFSILSREIKSSVSCEIIFAIFAFCSVSLLVLSAYYSQGDAVWAVLELVRTVMKMLITMFILKVMMSNHVHLEYLASEITFRHRIVTNREAEIAKTHAVMNDLYRDFKAINRLEMASMVVNLIIILPTFCVAYFSHWPTYNSFVIMFNIVQMTAIMFMASTKTLVFDRFIKELQHDTFHSFNLRININGYIPTNEILIAPLVSLIGIAVDAMFKSHE